MIRVRLASTARQNTWSWCLYTHLLLFFLLFFFHYSVLIFCAIFSSSSSFHLYSIQNRLLCEPCAMHYDGWIDGAETKRNKKFKTQMFFVRTWTGTKKVKKEKKTFCNFTVDVRVCVRCGAGAVDIIIIYRLHWMTTFFLFSLLVYRYFDYILITEITANMRRRRCGEKALLLRLFAICTIYIFN